MKTTTLPEVTKPDDPMLRLAVAAHLVHYRSNDQNLWMVLGGVT